VRCRQKTSICKRLEVKGINLFINILTEVTNEYSDTEPVMFILQGNRLCSRMTVTKGVHVLLQFGMKEKENGLWML
jgi:hypothetical protein